MNKEMTELDKEVIKESRRWRTWCYIVILLVGYIATLIFIYKLCLVFK